MFNKKKILILGGGNEQVPGIKISKTLGLKTIVIDKNNKCPGKKISDKFYNFSTSDLNNILKIAIKEKISAISTFASEKPLIIISKICSKLGLSCPNGNIIKNVTSKSLSKKIFQRYGIPFIDGKTFSIKDKKKINLFLNFKNKKKYVIKPSNSYGQNGVSLLENKLDLISKVNNAFKFSTENKIIIEKYLDGEELNVVGVVENQNFKILSISQRFTNHNLSFGIAFKHIYPSKLNKNKLKKLRSVSLKIIKSFKIKDSVIYFQFINHKNNIKIVEIATRTPGGFMYELSRYISGFDIIKFTILKSLGIKNAIKYSYLKSKKYNQLIIKFFTEFDFKDYRDTKKIKLNKVQNLPGFLNLIIYTKKLKKLKNSGGRIGAIFVSGKSKKLCKENLNRILNRIYK